MKHKCKFCQKSIKPKDIIVRILEEPPFPVGKFRGPNDIVFYHKGDILHEDCYLGKRE